MKTLFALALALCLVACAPTQSLAPDERAQIKDLVVASLLYSQFYNFGAEATGTVINVGSTSTRFRTILIAQRSPTNSRRACAPACARWWSGS